MFLGTFLGQKSFVLEKMSREKSTLTTSDRDENINRKELFGEIGEANKPFFSWKSMLLVIASLPPKQLQKLDSFINGVTSEGSDLSWSDYRGYEDIKTKMKRLIGSIKNEILPTSNRSIDVERAELISTANKLFDNSSEHMIEENQSQISSRSLSTSNQEQQQEQKQEHKRKLKFQNMHGRVRGIVIHGPSGCGKSFLAKIFAAEVRLLGL
jgi:ABC-type glutathione transport system ATPase component